MQRRSFVLGATGTMASLALAACSRDHRPNYSGDWVGASHERGHRLRDIAAQAKSGALPMPAVYRKAGAIVIGAGIGGLAAARALVRAGIDDVHVFELEDAAGGNSRGHSMAGMSCPLGAHYLPLPGDDAIEVIELLEEFGLRKTSNGVAAYDERHLCHAPQERLYINGAWHEGLLPRVEALPAAQRSDTLAQYRRFSAAVEKVSFSSKRARAFTIPTLRATWTTDLEALDRTTFAVWLDREGYTSVPLRWYLDYCCRDDYGAGIAQVSAWAGLHYFASRHGFHAAGDESDERDHVLTWPEGNAWLSSRMAAPLGARLHTGCVAVRAAEHRHDVDVDLWNEKTGHIERWTAAIVVLAIPLFISARLLESVPGALREAASLQRHSPWLVANLQLDEPLDDRAGAPPSWDNVIYGSASAGYVDAMHQSTRPYAGPTVLTAYWPLGGDSEPHAVQQRQRLLDEPWLAWSERVLSDLATAHPDLAAKVKHIDLMRYGHAMSIPAPGIRSSAALRALAESIGRIRYAHSDLSGYSVFEEALFHGTRVTRGLGISAISHASALRSLPPSPGRRA